MGDKISIWSGPEIAALLADRPSEGISRSGAINTAVSRYREICRRSLPTLTVPEWCGVFDALNGTWLLDEHSPAYIWAEVADSGGLGEKWGFDREALAATLRGLPYAGCVAVTDAVERFWATDAQPGDDRWAPLVERIVGAQAIKAGATPTLP